MIILTGGAGFIGSAFLQFLNSKSQSEILVVDNLGTSDKWKNLQGKKFIDYIHKDSFLPMLYDDHDFGDIDAVVHLGACSSTTNCDANYMLENNYRYSVYLADWCLENDIRFIYASSAATYGDGSQGFDDDEEKLSTYKALNVYGYSKHLFDEWVIRQNAIKQVAGLKFFNVYGPNEYHKNDMRSVIHKAYQQINSSGKLQLFRSYKAQYADGEQKRDFIYVADCCEVIWFLLNNTDVSGIFNVGTGHAETWNALANATFQAMGKAPNIEYIEMPETLRARYQYFTEAKMDKLLQVGYDKPFTSLANGIEDYVKNYLNKIIDPYL